LGSAVILEEKTRRKEEEKELDIAE